MTIGRERMAMDRFCPKIGEGGLKADGCGCEAGRVGMTRKSDKDTIKLDGERQTTARLERPMRQL